jgi:uncharacterized protein (TIGR02677 family)
MTDQVEPESPNELSVTGDTGPSRAGRRLGSVKQFDYLSSDWPLAGTYRAIMAVFVANRGTFGIPIPTGEVWARLGASEYAFDLADAAALEGLLERLEQRGNLRRSQDTQLVRTISELRAKRNLWQVTDEGWRAERAAREVEAVLRETGALRADALAALRKALDELAGFAAAADLDADAPGLLAILFGDLASRTEQLADNASTFVATLDEHLMRPEITVTLFLTLRDAIVDYVDDFLVDLRTSNPIIEAEIRILEETPALDRLIGLAAGYQPRPTFDGSDWRSAEEARIREGWATVCRWFVDSDGDQAVARYLGRRAAGAIADLVRILGRLNEGRHRTASTTQDFVTLARWFEATPDDDPGAAHRVWHGAFGLGAPRHLRDAHPDEAELQGNPRWTDVAPIRLPPRLREAGDLVSVGRTAYIADNRADLAWIMEREEREAAERVAAVARFLDRGPFRISDLPALGEAEFRLILDCLDVALGSAPGPSGDPIARSLDGRFFVAVEIPPACETSADLVGPHGTLRGDDYRIELASLTARGEASA